MADAGLLDPSWIAPAMLPMAGLSGVPDRGVDDVGFGALAQLRAGEEEDACCWPFDAPGDWYAGLEKKEPEDDGALVGCEKPFDEEAVLKKAIGSTRGWCAVVEDEEAGTSGPRDRDPSPARSSIGLDGAADALGDGLGSSSKSIKLTASF